VALDVDADLLNPMLAAGQGLAGTLWADIQTFAVPELKKIATQIAGIASDMLLDPPPYTQKAAASLLDMQVHASIGIIVGLTALSELAVQTAVNAILGAIRTTVNDALGFALLP
jgi:hypothetical protein